MLLVGYFHNICARQEATIGCLTNAAQVVDAHFGIRAADNDSAIASYDRSQVWLALGCDSQHFGHRQTIGVEHLVLSHIRLVEHMNEGNNLAILEFPILVSQRQGGKVNAVGVVLAKHQLVAREVGAEVVANHAVVTEAVFEIAGRPFVVHTKLRIFVGGQSVFDEIYGEVEGYTRGSHLCIDASFNVGRDTFIALDG